MKKYYLRHKYLQEFDYNDCNYLNYDTETEVFLLENYKNTDGYKTIFTDEEIEKLIKEKGFNLQDWIKVEVN